MFGDPGIAEGVDKGVYWWLQVNIYISVPADFRYGIKAAWSHPFEKTYFQSAVESLDKYTRGFMDVPVRPFDRRANTKRNRTLDLRSVDPNIDSLESLDVSGGEMSDNDGDVQIDG